MKAAVCYGNGLVKYEEVPTPIPQENEVKIRVKACGICGSDIPRALKQSARYYPIILGHEFSGIVEEIGARVTHVQVGDRVCGIPLIPCGYCNACRRGNFSLCKQYSFIGSRQQGAMAEYVVVPATNVYKFTANISFEQGALFEPATVALHAFYQNQYKTGGTVAILGGGTIGLFALQWAKILGCKKVVVFGRDKNHLKLAEELGADATISTCELDFKQQALAHTDGYGFDYLFEAAGSIQTIKHCFEFAALKAHICFVGTPNQELLFTIQEWEQMNRKELYITGSWMSYSAPFPGKEWEKTQQCFNNGELKFSEKMFFQKIQLENAQTAFNLFADETKKVKGRVLLTV